MIAIRVGTLCLLKENEISPTSISILVYTLSGGMSWGGGSYLLGGVHFIL